MGFFSNLTDALSKPRMVDPVRGTAQVVSLSMPPSQKGGGGMCVMNVVVTVPDQPSVAVQKASIVMLDKWPMPGVSLPVMADRADPRRFTILWDEVPTGADRGAQQAQQVAERMNQGGGGSSTGPSGGGEGAFRTNTTVTVNGAPASAADIAAFEAMTGMDLDGDGVIGTGPGGEAAQAPTRKVVTVSGDRMADLLGKFAAPGGAAVSGAAGPGSAGPDDTVTRLERLAALRDSGALTTAEFEAAKRKILG